MLTAGVLIASAGAANAAVPEQQCQRGRYFAMGKHVACVNKALARGVSDFSTKFEDGLAKCRVKYVQTWPTLQKQAAASTCGDPRFEDNGDGTVTDHLTGLVWEKKTDDASLHDKDNTYSWSTSAAGAGNGTAFTTFLATLNTGACFAGNCDWRLPTIAELLSILLPEPYPCTTNPCVDATVFGPINPFSAYWSASTDSTAASDPTSQAYSWSVFLDSGHVSTQFKAGNGAVRAVRGGL